MLNLTFDTYYLLMLPFSRPGRASPRYHLWLPLELLLEEVMDEHVTVPFGHVLCQTSIPVLVCDLDTSLHQPLHQLQVPVRGSVVKGSAPPTHPRFQVTVVGVQQLQGFEFSLQSRPVHRRLALEIKGACFDLYEGKQS